MSIGTIFTLFVTPAIYTLIARNYGGKRGEEAFVLKRGCENSAPRGRVRLGGGPLCGVPAGQGKRLPLGDRRGIHIREETGHG